MKFLKLISETKRLLTTLNKFDCIVFYVEDVSQWKHFDPIITELSQISSIKIVLITSDRSDPRLNCETSKHSVFYVGSGVCRTFAFVNLKCKVCVLTMPDLEYSFIKRSKFGVHYVYVHHAIVSTHAQYRERAFDYFDTIFCVGNHHENEHRRREIVFNIPKIYPSWLLPISFSKDGPVHLWISKLRKVKHLDSTKLGKELSN